MKENLRFERLETPLGPLYAVFSGEELAGVSMERPRGVKAGRVPDSFKKQMRAYFEGALRAFDQKIAILSGTEFEKSVWLTLRDIPYGETRTYGWLSERIGRHGAQRAVGQALARNPVPIVLPCHRVIESSGRLGGYSSGVEIKRRLLDMEYYHSVR